MGTVACDPTLAAGDPCSAENISCTGCTGPHPACLTQLTFGQTPFPLEGNYCSNNGCDPAHSADTCGNNGLCADLFGDGGNNLCYTRCTKKGACRSHYACITTVANAATQSVISVCLPPGPFSECDPTRMAQCTMFEGRLTSTLTNGDPNAACLRIGKDDVGQCRFLPCSIGPNNCPADSGGKPNGCLYLDFAKNLNSADPTDAFKGAVCVAIPKIEMQKKAGDACASINECGDNLTCFMKVCRQNCFRGTQPTFPDGMARYKNPATACPVGTQCTDWDGIGGATYAGICM